MTKIDDTLEKGNKFKNEYLKQLEEKAKFYDENDDYSKSDHKKTEKKKAKDADLQNKDLPESILEDIKYGADNIRVAIKEKHLGR
jgi:hypothetical protein